MHLINKPDTEYTGQVITYILSVLMSAASTALTYSCFHSVLLAV